MLEEYYSYCFTAIVCTLGSTCKKKRDFMVLEKGIVILHLLIVTIFSLGLIIITREVIELGHGVKMAHLG